LVHHQHFSYYHHNQARRDVDDARRLMDDKAEQLKAVGQLATMMAFFAVSAFCEIRIPEDTASAVILIFGVLNAVVVSECLALPCLALPYHALPCPDLPCIASIALHCRTYHTFILQQLHPYFFFYYHYFSSDQSVHDRHAQHHLHAGGALSVRLHGAGHPCGRPADALG
jgi:hypothetical protein